ncbi:PLC-like phosphodiesterase, partial [Cryphonectria parasitica EP155]
HIENIFAGLRGRAGDYITRDRLQEFLVETQGSLVRPLEKEIYTLGDFVYIWLHDYSAALKPAGKKDLSKPITNYFISSSHNTYIGLGNQLSGEVSAEAYRSVLENGCRCVEIDVWNGEGWSETRPRTPSGSKSPRNNNNNNLNSSDRSTFPTHKRHQSNMSTLSTSSIPDAARSLVDLMDQKWHELAGSVRERSRSRGRGRRPSSNASASMSQLHLTLPPASHSTTSLDNDLLDPNDGGPPLRHVRSAESREPRERRIEPEVTHAHTVQGLGDVGLADRIPFRQVCRVIRESAFKTNKLPVIVSLEVHATGQQQDMMAEIMKEEWGDHLLDRKLADCNPAERQPRLEELMEKILVKVKRPAAASFSSSKGGTSSSQLTVPLLREDDAGSDDERLSVAKSKTVIGQALGELAIYTHSEHFKDFSAPGAQSISHIFSIDEYKILKLHQTRHQEMFVHNRKFFMRAYPHSTRVNSTNLDPSLYWRKGVQMVALNWQRSHVDEAMMLNSAMFESEQGWVLKPQGYLSSDDTRSQAEGGRHRALKRLRITVLAGQLLPFPGESDSDCEASSASSMSTSDSTGFKPFLVTKCSETENPDWGVGQVLEFPPIANIVEELSFVRFKIEDEGLVKDKLAAWACIRLDRLQQGYRFIDLADAHGKPSAGKLLVNIDKIVQ